MPVNVTRGSLYTAAHDVDCGGIVPIIFRRYYSTGLLDRAPGVLGPGWYHAFEATIEPDLDGFTFFGHDGHTLTFDGSFDQLDAGASLWNLGHNMELRRYQDYLQLYHWHDYRQRVQKFFFQAGGDGVYRLTHWGLPDGHSLHISYDSQNRVKKVAQTLQARRLTFDYTAEGRLNKLYLNVSGRKPELMVAFEYDKEGRLLRTRNDLCVVQSYTYDDAGRMTSERYLGDKAYRMKYDDGGRCVLLGGEARHGERAFAYDEAGRQTVVTDSLGRKTTYQYNEGRQVEMTTLPNGSRQLTRYDEYGRRVSETTPSGFTTEYQYDGRGDRVALRYSTGGETTLTYNEEHEPIQVREFDGAVWRFCWARGALTEVVNPLGESTRYQYDEQNDLREVLYPGGSVVKYDHDPKWTRLVVADESGVLSREHFDVRLNPIESHDSAGLVKRFEYDQLGRRVSVEDRRDGGDGKRVITYDGAGQAIRYDQAGHVTHFRYKGYDLPTEIEEASGRIYKLEWDSEKRNTAIINGAGQKTTFIYDDLDRVVKTEYYDGSFQEYEYDEAGFVVAGFDGVNRLQYENDELGRLLEVTADGLLLASFTYDLAGNIVASTRGEERVTLERDALGRIVAETQNGRTVRTTLSPMGRVRTRDFEGSRAGTLNYNHDGRGRLRAFFSEKGVRQGFDYTSNDLLIRRNFLNFEERFEYDPRGLPSKQWVGVGNAKMVFGRAFQFDAAGQIQSVKDSRRGEALYGYNASQELVRSEHFGLSPVEFVYDAGGNRVNNRAGERLFYQPADRLNMAGAARLDYDNAGRVISRTLGDQVTRYHWHKLGHLDAVERPDGRRIEYHYDGFGRRTRKCEGDQETRFYWQGNQLMAVEREDRLTEYVIDGFRPLLMFEDGVPFHVIHGLCDEPLEVVDDQGETAWWGTLDEWGKLVAQSGDEHAPMLRYSGQYYDEESGLSYNRFRYYSAEDGLFLSPDPLGFAAGPFRYRYAPNPLNFIDPFGLACGGSRGQSVYVLTKGQPPKIVYVGITEQCPRERMMQHSRDRAAGEFDSMRVIATDMDTRRDARNLEGSALHHINEGNIRGVEFDGLENRRISDDSRYYHSYHDPNDAARPILPRADVQRALDRGTAGNEIAHLPRPQ
ncbi:RHS repeat-associated core domain-containing protein [Acanthopleuribacter pedis]|uniref:Uncharacterized protein n=1 Tax=Acanthopleuribacter pedis TaxID=442870 RepID=A0A8J7U561_9BACT|nr:RHS repeat-associated core domain-containing protein [Acanthopleuribacter pedis]MBO1322203.1 hypothetical protein [Acanthopleuribacter pedis]